MKSVLFYQVKMFLITFLTYSIFSSSRTTWSYIQNYMRNDPDLPNYNESFTGTINLCFLFSYAIAMKMFTNLIFKNILRIGPYADKIGMKYFIGIGSLIGGISFGLIGLLDFDDFGLSQFISLRYVYIVLMIINGVAQSTGWPTCVSVMGSWFLQRNVGVLMGFWSGCCNFGDAIGLLIGDIVIQRLKWDWPYAILISSSLLLLAGLANIFLLQSSPEEVFGQRESYTELLQGSLPPEQNTLCKTKASSNGSEQLKGSTMMKHKRVTFLNAWLLPGVTLYVLTQVCLKGTFQGFLYWLPTYFQRKETLAGQSAYIAQMFDFGTFIGGITIGIIGDKIKKRAILIVPSLMIASVLMCLVYYVLGDAALPYYLVILGIGIFQGGPYNNISGTIVIELSRTPELKGNKEATTTVAALIEGSGTFVAGIFQVCIPYIGDQYLFLFFTSVTGVATLSAMFLLYKEMKKAKKQSKIETLIKA